MHNQDQSQWLRRQSPFLDHLGMKRERIAAGIAEVSLTLLPQLQNLHGAGHGGVVMTLLDSAMALAALSRINFTREVVTVNMQVGFLRPAQGHLRATGRATGGGNSICFCEASIVNDGGELVAQSMGAFRYRVAGSAPLASGVRA